MDNCSKRNNGVFTVFEGDCKIKLDDIKFNKSDLDI